MDHLHDATNQFIQLFITIWHPQTVP